MSEERQRRRNERIMLADEHLARARAMLQNGKIDDASWCLFNVLEMLRDIARLDAQEER